MKDDEIKVPVQINGKTKAVIEISADATKEEALEAGKAAIADKLHRQRNQRNLRTKENHKYCNEIGSAHGRKRGKILLVGI